MVNVDIESINPDQKTIENIVIMVKRCLSVFERRQERVVKTGFGFLEEGDTNESADRNTPLKCGYSMKVSFGDGDVLTEHTLYDFKVSKSKPTSKDTLQVLMYWIMGQRSNLEIFQGNRFICLLNPRMGVVYTCDTNEIDPQIIEIVKNEVMCYEI